MPRLDRQTFDQLVREHHAAVYRSARRVLRCDGDAEDIAQDVFVRALDGKVPLGEGGDRAALCWLATRLALNTLRGNRRRTEKEHRATMPHVSPTPIEQLAGDELRRSVHRSIDELPDELRLPLLLRFQDQLTYAAVGSTLAVSETTAHERVQAALQKLRRRLEGAGFAVTASGLPELVAGVPPHVPPGLEGRLLAIGTTKTAVAAASKLAAVVLLLGLVVVGGIAWLQSGERRVEPLSASGTAAPRVVDAGAADPVERTPVPTAANAHVPATDGGPQEPATREPIVYRGAVHDASAWPVGNARVVAVAAGGLKPFEYGATVTDAAGAFRLELPLEGEPVTPMTIRIRVLEQSHLLLETDEMVLPRGGQPEPLELVLPRSAGIETERFVLSVTVRDDAGAPLADVPVALYAAGDPPPRPGSTPAEAEDRTDALGVARLPGRRPGARLVFADGRPLGRRAATSTVRIEQPGPQDATLTIGPGRTLRGHAGAVDGAELPWANVWLQDETLHLHHRGKLQAGGAFEFAALGDGPYTLHVDSQDCSPAELRGLSPDREPVDVLLKRRSDTRDVGTHMAEIHGRLIDAATGVVVTFGDEDVQVRPALDGESTSVFDRIEPPRPVQVMLSDARHDAFHLVGLTAGRWGVVVHVEGYATAAAIVELHEDELRAGLEIPLQRPATVRGRVVDATGAGVAGAFVSVLGYGARADQNLAALDARQQAPDRRYGAGGSLPCAARTDADGSFTLMSVPPDVRLRVIAVATGHAPATGPARTLQSGATQTGCELQLGSRRAESVR